MPETHIRRLQIAGAYNIRDLGGYATRTGDATAWRAFVRADSLHNVMHEGQAELRRYGVNTVIDLRTPGGVAKYPNPLRSFPDVTYRHIAVVDDSKLPGGSGPAMPASLAELYRMLLEEAQPALGEIFATMAAAQPGTLLFHCTAGKDRTGLVAALLLELAGVERPVVLKDYCASAANLAPLYAEYRRAMAEQMSPDERARFEQFLGSDSLTMASALSYLDRRYGGAATYLRRAGLDDAQLARLTSRLSSRATVTSEVTSET